MTRRTLDLSLRALYVERHPLTRARRLGTLSASEAKRLRAIEAAIDRLERAEASAARALVPDTEGAPS